MILKHVSSGICFKFNLFENEAVHKMRIGEVSRLNTNDARELHEHRAEPESRMVVNTIYSFFYKSLAYNPIIIISSSISLQ